jgi:phenylalanyl-tRNA synthetase beta subunit
MFSPNIPITSVYQPGRSAGVEIEGELRGVVGEFNSDVIANFKLPESSAGFELDLSWISENFSLDPVYSPLTKFPSVSQDLTIKSEPNKNYQGIYKELKASLEAATEASQIKFRISPISIFQKEVSKSKNITFSLDFWHP